MTSDKTIRESLQDAIANVSPYQTPVLSMLGQVPVKHTYPQWLQDSFRSAATNAWIEDTTFTAHSKTVPTRASNRVQTFYWGGRVTDTERQIAHAGMGDPLVYYEAKDIVEFKKDIELAIVKGSAATGTTDEVMQMNGFLNFASTNKTELSGVTLTEIQFNNVLQLVWSNGTAWPTEAFMGPNLKRTISIYSTKVTPFLDATDGRQVLVTDQYKSDFGTVNMHLHRELATSSGDAANELLVIDPSFFRTGWLQPLKSELLPRDGLRQPYQMSAKLTVLHRHEAGAAVVTNCRSYITS